MIFEKKNPVGPGRNLAENFSKNPVFRKSSVSNFRWIDIWIEKNISVDQLRYKITDSITELFRAFQNVC